jgi:hypothetical protein
LLGSRAGAFGAPRTASHQDKPWQPRHAHKFHPNLQTVCLPRTPRMLGCGMRQRNFTTCDDGS